MSALVFAAQPDQTLCLPGEAMSSRLICLIGEDAGRKVKFSNDQVGTPASSAALGGRGRRAAAQERHHSRRAGFPSSSGGGDRRLRTADPEPDSTIGFIVVNLQVNCLSEATRGGPRTGTGSCSARRGGRFRSGLSPAWPESAAMRRSAGGPVEPPRAATPPTGRLDGSSRPSPAPAGAGARLAPLRIPEIPCARAAPPSDPDTRSAGSTTEGLARPDSRCRGAYRYACDPTAHVKILTIRDRLRAGRLGGRRFSTCSATSAVAGSACPRTSRLRDPGSPDPRQVRRPATARP